MCLFFFPLSLAYKKINFPERNKKCSEHAKYSVRRTVCVFIWHTIGMHAESKLSNAHTTRKVKKRDYFAMCTPIRFDFFYYSKCFVWVFVAYSRVERQRVDVYISKLRI